MKWVYLLIFVLLGTGSAWAGTWGGTDDQIADSIDAAATVSGTNADSNFGASTVLRCKKSGATIERTYIIRFKNDPHTSGYTQDSARFFIDWHGVEPDGANDTMILYGRVIKREWGEGTKDGATAAAGECSFNAAQQGTQNWTTAGCLSNGNDRNATVACSLVVVGPITAGTQVSCKIEGTHLTQEFFDYGIVWEAQYANAGAGGANIDGQMRADDYVTAGDRPYFIGYETAPVGGVLSIGATSFGVVTVGK